MMVQNWFAKAKKSRLNILSRETIVSHSDLLHFLWKNMFKIDNFERKCCLRNSFDKANNVKSIIDKMKNLSTTKIINNK